MDTAEKIDFLMRVTGTSNAQLARALSFDASYISRIRAGKRGLPPRQPFVEPAAAFFARNVEQPRQAEFLAHEMGLTAWPATAQEASRLIAAWLEGTVEPVSSPVTDRMVSADPASKPGKTAEVHLYFGNEGRRQVALAFLKEVARANRPCELLLQSDEETTWMYEDPTFTDTWARLMDKLVEMGCTLTVIHTVSRNGSEMWEGLREWLPLYLSGAIRPYYYPRLRDGVRMRSLFVACGRCALVSSSVAGMAGDSVSIMLSDVDAVAAYEREFDAYRALCQPLAEAMPLEPKADLHALASDLLGEGVVEARVLGSIVFIRPEHGALIATTGKRPVAYHVSEPRLVDALTSYVEHLPKDSL